jgi:hypothetical protein
VIVVVASRDTIDQVFSIIERFVPRKNISPMLDELANVKGNASFTRTVTLLKVLAVDRMKE